MVLCFFSINCSYPGLKGQKGERGFKGNVGVPGDSRDGKPGKFRSAFCLNNTLLTLIIYDTRYSWKTGTNG